MAEDHIASSSNAVTTVDSVIKALEFLGIHDEQGTSPSGSSESQAIERFLMTFLGQPRRHLLTTRWSAFVNKKKLISGDAVLFLRGDNGELRLEIRRAVQLKNSGPYSVPCSQMLNLGTLAAVANAVSMKSVFHIYYNPRRVAKMLQLNWRAFSTITIGLS